MSENILIVDDEQDIRDMIAAFLQDEGYETNCVANAQDAQTQIHIQLPSLIILDIWMRDSSMDGISLLNWIKDIHPDIPIIMISGHGTVEIAVNAIKAGAYDFIEKPFKSEKLVFMVKRALENSILKQENAELKQQVRRNDRLIGNSTIINNLRQSITKVSQTNSRVLITGPSGSGKEICARTIHQESRRNNFSFIHANCSMINDDELFGSQAKKKNSLNRIGMFEKADKGTLYLEEICDLSIDTQGKLIHAIQQQRFKRIGSDFEVSVDVRVISSSSRNLQEQISKGLLREDLYYRLSVVPIEMPCLKDHSQDIPELIEYYMNSEAAILNTQPRILDETAIKSMQNYSWPGNQNQLRNVIDWLLIMAPKTKDNIITVEMLPPEINFIQRPNNQTSFDDYLPNTLKEARENFEKEYLKAQIDRFGGNISKTANFIGMERSALHRKIKILKLN